MLSGVVSSINCGIWCLTDKFFLSALLFQQLPGHCIIPFWGTPYLNPLSFFTFFLPTCFGARLWQHSLVTFTFRLSHVHVAAIKEQKSEDGERVFLVTLKENLRLRLWSQTYGVFCQWGRATGAGWVAGEAKLDQPGTNRFSWETSASTGFWLVSRVRAGQLVTR